MTINEFEQIEFITSINPETNAASDIYIDHYGFENCNKNKKPVFMPENPYFRLHFIIKGSLFLKTPQKTTLLNKNTMFLLTPGTEIGYYTNTANPSTHYYVVFNGKKAYYFLEKMGFNFDDLFITIPNNLVNDIRQIFFKNFFISQNLIPCIPMIFNENFFALLQKIYLSQLNLSKKIDTQKNTLKNDTYIDKALDYINIHYTEYDFTLKKVAQHLYLNENYFSSVFKAYTHTSFKSHINNLRIHLALTLIRSGHTSITEIANIVGIPDVSYFTKVFKKFNHITPSEEIAKYKELTIEKSHLNN